LLSIGLNDWLWALSNLREQGLIAQPDPQDPTSLDAHPLLRAYFQATLMRRAPSSWQAGNLRLYEALTASVPETPETLAGLSPLLMAVQHGCRAGRQREAFREVYWRRIKRGAEHYHTKKLGAFGSDLTALSGFFDRPWDRPSEALSLEEQAFVLNQAGFDLRALGRLREAVRPMRAGLDMQREQKSWALAAMQAGNLSELQLDVGEVESAVATAEEGVRPAFADRRRRR
jgi:hypothetical protein